MERNKIMEVIKHLAQRLVHKSIIIIIIAIVIVYDHIRHLGDKAGI